MIRAWFINELGNKFTKDFESNEVFEAFIYKARRAGTRLLGFSTIN